MFLPLKDHNPTVSRPVVTVGLIVLNALFFLVELGQGSHMGEFIARWGATPFELTHFTDLVGRVPGTQLVHVPGPGFLPLTALSSMFLHGSWAHLIFNMWFLWIFGNNVEDFLGAWRYLLFYLSCGLLGLLTHVAVAPSSVIPTIGASGAIAGVMGAYMVLYPRARILSWLFPIFLLEVPAALLIAFWMGLQILGGLTGLGLGGGGVAYWAHIGGFIAGYMGIRRLHRARLEEHLWRTRWRQLGGRYDDSPLL